ncbi:MAG: hypothetical protein ACI8P3_000428 [Saprospiraceae bacterium]|jgi:hypothetical protein
MLSNKLISLLNSFSKVDLNRFEKYLLSPFLNENKEQVKLFNILNEQLRNTDPDLKLIKKQEVWRKVFGKTIYNDTLLRRLCSDLTQMALNYLAYKEYKNQPLLIETNMLSATNTPKLDKHFSGILRKAKARQGELKSRNTVFHYNNFQIELNCHKNLEFLGKKRKNFENFVHADYHLDCFYILQKLKNYCDLLGYKNIISLEIDITLFPSFLVYVKESKYMEEAAIKAFYLVTEMLLDTEEEKYYHELKKVLNQRFEEFAYDDLKILYIHLRNYCIDTKINMGRSDYFKELFALYKDQVKSEIIVEDDFITAQNYKNIITVALHINEFEWVESFIQKYTDRLPPENQDNDRNYNLAKVYFHQQEYTKVIEQLREVEYKNVIYSLGGKLMLLKTYFELKEFLALDFLVDSFRIYLRRSGKIPKEVKQQYINILRFTKKLADVQPRDQITLLKIKEQVINCKALAAKKWLIEKIGEMER